MATALDKRPPQLALHRECNGAEERNRACSTAAIPRRKDFGRGSEWLGDGLEFSRRFEDKYTFITNPNTHLSSNRSLIRDFKTGENVHTLLFKRVGRGIFSPIIPKLLTHSFNCFFTKYLLRAGLLLGAGDAAVSRADRKACPWGASVLSCRDPRTRQRAPEPTETAIKRLQGVGRS